MKDATHKNLSSSEVEVLLQEVNSKQTIIFSSVSSGYKIQQQQQKDAWDAVTSSVNAVEHTK